ncbi:MAG TPA: hypothetical protein VLL52_23765 [Anaerolineae bacterium]|nr:hypothetical protein [Anaerolineae bacterium]
MIVILQSILPQEAQQPIYDITLQIGAESFTFRVLCEVYIISDKPLTSVKMPSKLLDKINSNMFINSKINFIIHDWYKGNKINLPIILDDTITSVYKR